MRRRKSRSVGIVSRQAKSLIRGRGNCSRESFLESIDGRLDFSLYSVIKRFLCSDVFQDRGIAGFHELQKLLFETAHFCNRDVVNGPAGCHKDAEHLLFDRKRYVLILLEDFRKALAARQLSLRDFVELVSPELREGRELAVLRHIQP